MYSAGLNNYCRFASGEGFQKAKDKILLLDIPIAPEEAVTIEQNTWKRSGIMRTQVIEFSGYSCEIMGSMKVLLQNAIICLIWKAIMQFQ
jgi:5-methylcytosine-specific restriction protein A